MEQVNFWGITDAVANALWKQGIGYKDVDPALPKIGERAGLVLGDANSSSKTFLCNICYFMFRFRSAVKNRKTMIRKVHLLNHQMMGLKR